MARSMVREVSVRIGCGLSTSPDPRVAAIEAGTRARAALGGAGADVAFLFCTGRHLAAPEATRGGVAEALDPPALVGCGAGGVLGDGREIESGTAVAVWAAALGGGMADAFPAEAIETPDGVGVSGLSHLEDATAAVLLPDPYTFPTDAVLGELGRRWPGDTILGGLASGPTPGGAAGVFVGDRVVGAGAVGVRFHDVEILPCVSQGAAPVGPELTVTASEGNVIHELAGRPALERLRDAIEELTFAERGMVASGLLLGVVIDGGKPEYRQGDFLVRPLLGADPEEGTVAVGAPVEPGSVVRMHARDARSADRDLGDPLGRRVGALGGATPAGALVFTCNGRGRSMFGVADHDALALDEALPGAPAAGFFAAGGAGAGPGAPRRSAPPPPRGSSPPARSGRSAATCSCTGSRRRSRCSRGEPRRAERPAHGRDGRSRPGHRAPGAPRGRPADPPRAADRRARAARDRDRGAVGRRRPHGR